MCTEFIQIGAFAALLTFFLNSAFADENVVRCEHSKVNTEDPDTLGKGLIQFQFNEAYRRYDKAPALSGEDKSSYHTLSEIVLTYGATDNLDLAIGSGYAWLTDYASTPFAGEGISDLNIGAKWRFFADKERGFALGYVPTLIIPTAETPSGAEIEPGQEFWSIDTRFVALKDWTPLWTTNFDIGYDLAFGDRHDRDGAFGTNFAVGYHLHPWFQPEVELNYTHEFLDQQDTDLLAVTVGAELPLSSLVCARIGAQRGIYQENVVLITTVSMSVEFTF